MIRCILKDHISTTIWLSYVFLFYHGGRHKHAKKTYFIFEILHYEILKIQNMKTIVVIFGSHDKF